MKVGIAVFFAAILVCAPLSPAVAPGRAEAASGDVASLTAAAVSCVAGNYLAGILQDFIEDLIEDIIGEYIGISAPEVPVDDSVTRTENKKNTAKGYCLDNLFWAIAKLFLHQTRDSIVNWINTGFQGDPLYVTNYENYLKTATEQEMERLVRQITRSGSRYAESLVISLVDPHYDTENIGDVLQAQCENGVERLALQTSPPTQAEYLAGDYRNRMLALERGKRGNAGKNSSFLAQVGSLFAQADDDTCGEGFHPDPVTGVCVADGDNDPGNVCGSTKERKEARVDNFITGDFYSGGWPGWLALTQNQQNNIYGKTLAYQSYTTQIKNRVQEEKRTKYIAHKGFLAQEECAPGKEEYEEYVDEEGEPQQMLVGCSEYIVVTPGDMVAGAAKELIGSSLRESEAADSIGEAIDAIIQALVNKLINDGVASLKNRGSGGGGGGGGTGGNAKQTLLDSINPRITSSEQYLALRQASLIKERELVGLISTLSAGITAAGGQAVCPIAYGRVSEDIDKLSQYSARVAGHEAEITALPPRINAMKSLRNRVQALSATADATSFVTEFAQLLAQFSYPSSTSVNNARAEKEDIEAKVTALDPERGACQREKDNATASSTPPVSA